MNKNEQQSLQNVWGEPIVYKEVKIYPIKLKDALNFYQYVTCLTLEKNTIPNPQIIKMSYLDFIIAISQQKQYKFFYENLIKLLLMVFKEQVFYITTKDNKIIIKILNDYEKIKQYNKLYKQYNLLLSKYNKNKIEIKQLEQLEKIKEELNKFLINDSVILTGKDFNNIRKIILKQNLIKFDDELVNKEVQKALQEAQDFINKKNEDKKATLEELILSYACNVCNGKPQDFKDIKNLTIYQFYKVLQRKSLSKKQMMLSTALGMGALAPKDIPDWLDHIQEGNMYDDVILKDEEISNLQKLNK